MNTLAQCTALDSLTLKHRPFSFEHAHSSDEFLESVCEVFDSYPPPFPSLERLELWMVDREGAMISASTLLCARLARCLLDGSRYPMFRRLILRVHPQVWLAASENWVARDGQVCQENSEDGQMVERWRVAFAAFGKGVGLDVHLQL
ncbi:hypothetical protein FKP32DRAFT_1590987 [Trametes sanguinea]|nr:hypothetical protein FKP32DRAFT_1590987 [Trametes sanguinea]